ncbi:hypothetical protein [Nafulsella turpanensis]|uniref:hypothetical protein n=1 Tax=Nafulsella turpanensis TaxID=1265690 RepID=UPI00034DA6F2|nr:hypothetical protein [Nafulsella turpanensis]
MLLYSAIGAVALALVHFFAYKLHFSSIPRSKWLSAAGGVSVSYVFIHLLPELSEFQEALEEKKDLIFDFLTHHVYLIALLSLSLFYGLERTAKLSHESKRGAPAGMEKEESNTSVFWIHVSSFTIYNALIGYLLVHREEEKSWSLLLFVIAMAFHFVVNDYGLVDHYRKEYIKKGRWIITAAILGGWGIGVLTTISETLLSLLFAFVGGGIILNVLKEELPEERKSNFWAFLTGVVLYTTLLMVA